MINLSLCTLITFGWKERGFWYVNHHFMFFSYRFGSTAILDIMARR